MTQLVRVWQNSEFPKKPLLHYSLSIIQVYAYQFNFFVILPQLFSLKNKSHILYFPIKALQLYLKSTVFTNKVLTDPSLLNGTASSWGLSYPHNALLPMFPLLVMRPLLSPPPHCSGPPYTSGWRANITGDRVVGEKISILTLLEPRYRKRKDSNVVRDWTARLGLAWNMQEGLLGQGRWEARGN